MTDSVRQLLDVFDSLTEAERQEAVAEIALRRREENESSIDIEDDELVRIAEMSFLELDAREAAEEKP